MHHHPFSVQSHCHHWAGNNTQTQEIPGREPGTEWTRPQGQDVRLGLQVWMSQYYWPALIEWTQCCIGIGLEPPNCKASYHDCRGGSLKASQFKAINTPLYVSLYYQGTTFTDSQTTTVITWSYTLLNNILAKLINTKPPSFLNRATMIWGGGGDILRKCIPV